MNFPIVRFNKVNAGGKTHGMRTHADGQIEGTINKKPC